MDSIIQLENVAKLADSHGKILSAESKNRIGMLCKQIEAIINQNVKNHKTKQIRNVCLLNLYDR